MFKKVFTGFALTAAFSMLAMAQKPKSQKEVEALQAVMSAQTPDARITAVEDLISKFSDTEFKSWAYSAAADAAQMKRDVPKAIFYYEQSLKADPKNHGAMLMLAGVIAQNTKEFDLDKDDKLAKAEKYAKDAMAMIPSAAKPNNQVTDAQWDAQKKDDMAQAHVDLGMIATVRKKYDVAATEFKTAVDTASQPDAVAMIRLAGAYTDGGKYDDAVTTLDKVLAMSNLNAQIKQVAESEKARAQKAKTAK